MCFYSRIGLEQVDPCVQSVDLCPDSGLAERHPILIEFSVPRDEFGVECHYNLEEPRLLPDVRPELLFRRPLPLFRPEALNGGVVITMQVTARYQCQGLLEWINAHVADLRQQQPQSQPRQPPHGLQQMQPPAPPQLPMLQFVEWLRTWYRLCEDPAGRLPSAVCLPAGAVCVWAVCAWVPVRVPECGRGGARDDACCDRCREAAGGGE